MRLLILILLIIALLLESSVTTVSLLIPIIVVATVLLKDSVVFLLAFIFGILLDILAFKMVGVSSMFLTFLVFLILMYERKFEIQTPSFIIFSTFISSFIFLLIFQRGNVIFQSIISTLIGFILFEALRRVNFQKHKDD